jgi:hypothetical protein
MDPARAMEAVRAPRLRETRRCSLERLNQRPRRDRLCETGDASGLKRSRTNGRVVARSHVDDRQRTPSRFQAMPQLDA